MALPRLLPALVCALLAVPAAAVPASAAAAAPAPAPVEVTAIIERPDGGLSFESRTATSARAGADLARRLDARPEVVAAAVEQPVRAVGTADPLRTHQWGLTKLAAEQVWASGGAEGQLIAVLDTGVDAAHPDLAGFVDAGKNMVADTATATIDPHGHGTHVAGVVAAAAENGIGGAGLARSARIMPVRVLDADGSGSDGDVARGMVWAVDNGATVLNLSLGGPNPSGLLTSAVEYALSKGVVVVASAGNAGANGDPILYPAATPGVIAVGAVAADDSRPAWSSTGAHLSVVAPGVGIVSTLPGDRHASWSGTSMAAPFVAAAVALLRATEPALTPAQLRTRLMSTARDLGAPGPDAQHGAGLIDVMAARAAGRPAPAPVETVQPAPAVSQPVTSAPASAAPVVAEPVAPAPAPVAPAPAPVAPAPAPVAPAPAPVAPAPAPVAPAPAPVAPAPAPVAPAPAPVAPAPAPVAPAPAPVAPAPAPVAPAPAETAPAKPVVEPAPVRPAPIAAPRTDTVPAAAPSVSVFPAAISAGQRVTVTYRGTPGAVVDILSRTQPATTFSRIGSVTLDGTGTATSTHAPQKNTRITARSASGEVSSEQPIVAVRSVASLSVQRVGTRTYAFTGRVYPALDRRLVNLYRNGVLVAQGRTDARGIYRITKQLAGGTFTFQARTPNDQHNLGASSPLRRALIS